MTYSGLGVHTLWPLLVNGEFPFQMLLYASRVVRCDSTKINPGFESCALERNMYYHSLQILCEVNDKVILRTLRTD